MYKIKPFNFTRSQTKQQLPTINMKTQRSGTIKQKSYLGEIAKQISGNIEYDDMDSKNLNKEQRKLKQILKKMNDDTVKIIADYTPRVKKVEKHHRTASTILAINQKQVQNNYKIIEQCVNQIEKLKQRVQGLNTEGKSSYHEYIDHIYQSIAQIKQQNQLLRAQNQRRGRSIINQQRIIEDGLIKKAQNDVFLAEHKASHLRYDDQRVQQQIKEYQKKLQQINQKWLQADKYLKQQDKKLKQQNNLKNNEIQLLNKKATLQNIRKKNQFYNQNYQYRYYSLLKQLQVSNMQTKQTQQKIDKTFVTIQASKIILMKLQTQLQVIKQNKKIRQEQVNEFLIKAKEPHRQGQKQKQKQKQKSRSYSKSEQRIVVLGGLEGEKQMLSQISAKQNMDDNHSDIELGLDPVVTPRATSKGKNGEQREDVLINQQ